MAKTSKTNAARHLVGVDFGGTKILAAVFAPNGQIIARHKVRTRAGEGGPDAVIDRIARCTLRAIELSKVPKSKILAVGIGAPGPLNAKTGVVEAPPNLPGWANVPLKTALERVLGLRVFVENDVNAGTYGEFRRGAGVGMHHIVGIFLGTGIGGGLILNGRLFRGFTQTAGEIGHLTVMPGGPLCGCGRRGCLEAFAGRLAIGRRIAELAESVGSSAMEAAEGNPAKLRSKLIARAWREKDPAVMQALGETAQYVGIAIGGVANLLNPELFILGGGLMEALGDAMLPMITEAARQHSMPNAFHGVSIRSAMLHDDAGITGAALLALDRIKS